VKRRIRRVPRLGKPAVALSLTIIALLTAGAVVFHRVGRAIWYPVYRSVAGSLTVEDVLREYGPAAEQRLRPSFVQAGLPYPPARVTLLVFKQEKVLEFWAEGNGRRAFVRSYPILAASGRAGPKLREGDRQVPEGIYQIIALNPNSSYHLSMQVDYPNRFDREKAAGEGRTNLGGEIFIHGKAVSIGCIAVGDEAIEELFCLVARVGAPHVKVIIAPSDLRRGPAVADLATQPRWVPELYARLAAELRAFPPRQ